MAFAFPTQRGLGACETVADALRRAGFPEFVIPVMVAISRAESGCRTEATAVTPREYSVGPLQLNLRAHPWVTEDCARDPYCAAQAAYRISGGGRNLRPWSTYVSGAFRRFLPKEVEAELPPDLSGGGTPTLASPFSPVPSPGLTSVLVLTTALILGIVAISAIRGG